MEQNDNARSLWFNTRELLIKKLIDLNNSDRHLKKLQIGDEYIYIDKDDMDEVLNVVLSRHIEKGS